MQVTQIDLNNPLAERVRQLKLENGISIFMGNYRNAIKAQRELAKIGVDNFELMTKIESPVKGTVPLLSKLGFRLLLAMLIDKIRYKTPEEKKYRKMCNLFKKGVIKF
jgi:hypothetical protein